MTTIFVKPHVTADIDGQLTVAVEAGQATLDALAVPYAKASVQLALQPAGLTDLDPREDVRVIVTAEDQHAGTSRTFNLGLRERTIDHTAKTVDLTLASDEAILTDYASLADDNGARAHEASLRAVCEYVLAKAIPGATLDAGSADADVTAYWQATNHVTNPRAETLDGFTQGANVGPWGVDSSSGGQYGQNYVYWYSAAAGESYLYVSTNASAKPGDKWTAQANFRADGAGRTCRLIMHFRDNNDALIAQAVGANVPAPVAPAWAEAVVSGTAPPGTVRCNLIVLHNATGATQAVGVEGISMIEGAEPVPFFSGATPADGRYVYRWDGLPDASSSTRLPVLARAPELFVWRPGVTAWDYLEPLTSSAGLRLFCDEQRVWRLIDPAVYSVPGVATLSGFNIAYGADTISRDDAEVFATGVVVRYTGRNSAGEIVTTLDVAGTPEKVAVIDYERPYPGPGAAAAILARRDGTGRVQDVTAVVNWHATPGQEASISLPGAPLQRGKISSVVYPLDAEPLMQVGTRGLIDIPADSWDYGTDAVTWANVTGNWDTFAWPPADDDQEGER